MKKYLFSTILVLMALLFFVTAGWSANTVNKTNRTIEVSAIDSDYIMDMEINVESVVLIPGAADDQVTIREYTGNVATSPTSVLLISGDGEPRVMYYNQRKRLCFDFTDATLTQGAKIIFNIGERR
jgi:hypothetical protein